MKKMFVYNSQISEDGANYKIRRVPPSDVRKSIETRRRLFRQPQSCPHFSIRIDNFSESSEESSRRHYLKRNVPESLNIDALLETKVNQFSGNEFLYLTFSVSESNEYFTPYSFKEVPYRGIDRSKFFTISRHGVTMWSKEECYFTPLDVWIEEYHLYCKIMTIKTFSMYRLWKSFKNWSKLIKRQKFVKNKKALAKVLLLANPRLAKSIFEYKRTSELVENMQIFHVENNSVWNLKEFVDHQMSMYKSFKDKIDEFCDQITHCLFRAALEALHMEGFSIEDQISNMSLIKYMDRLKKRQFCQLITRYLRYIDYMTMSLLYEMALRATLNFLEMIESPNKKNIDQDKIRVVPVFAVKIALKKDEISISPSQQEVVESLREMIDQSLEFVRVVKPFGTNEVFKKFTVPIIGGVKEQHLPDETVLNINYLSVDKRLSHNQSRIIFLVNENFEDLKSYMEGFNKYCEFYAADLQTNANDLEQLSDVQELQYYCERYMGQMNDIKVIDPFKNYGIFELDQRCFDDVMTPLYQRLYGKICTHLPVLLSNLLTEMNEMCQEIMGTLLTPPEGTLGYVDYINFINKCDSMLFDIHDKLTTVDQLLGLIVTYQIEAGDDLWKRFKSISEFLVNCKDAHAKKLNQKDTFIEKLSTSIDKDVYKVYEEVTAIKQEINKDWILSHESQPGLVKDTLTNALEQLQLANGKLIQLQIYCESMELDLIDMTIFVDVQLEAKIRLNLWESLEEWTDSIQDWYTQNFHQLDIEKMKSTYLKILEQCMVFEKDLPPNTISPKLKASVELFKGKIEIISQLRNSTLKPRHWTVIEEIIDKKIVEDDTITIRDFEEAGVFKDNIATQLVEISSRACAEQKLDEQLSSIEKFWMRFELKFEKYRYYRNNFVLTNIEEVGMHLDDSFVRMNVIRNSKYVKPIRDRIDQWIIHLNICMDTLSQWSAFQCNWSRFEALFSLPGVEYKIPDELQLFNHINNTWKETIFEVHENRLAIVALLRPGRLDTFKDCNRRITVLSDRMDHYLNTRRLNYPRLYFLSNVELITILTEQPKDIKRIEKYLPKLFDSIFGLKVCKENIKCLLEPVYSITHMASETGFEVPLYDDIRVEGSADQWLKVLEMEMVNTIRKEIRIGYQTKTYEEERVSIFEQGQLTQVQLVINRLKLFNEVERYFEDPQEETERKFADILQLLKDEMNILKPHSQNSILTSLIFTLIYYHDIIQRIKAKGIDQPTFQKIWRYKWINDSPFLSINDFLIPYFNEFIFLGEDFLFTPQTEKVYYHFQQVIKSGLNNLLIGSEAAGKTSTVRAFSKLVAKFTITFDCNTMNTNYSDFQRILFGIVQTGSWSIFRGIDRVSKNILSVIGDQLMLIKDVKVMQSKEIELTGKIMKFNPWNHFFFVSNLSVQGLTTVPENIKIYLREVSIHLPNSKAIKEFCVNLQRHDLRSKTCSKDELTEFNDAIENKIIIILHRAPGSGKSNIWKTYIDSYNASNSEQISYKKIYINSLPVKELYGYYNDAGKWIDGFFEKTFQQFYKANPIEGKLLIILDGQIRSHWIGLLMGINSRRRFITLPNLSLLRIPERSRIVIETMCLEETDFKQFNFIGVIKLSNENTDSAENIFQEYVAKSTKISSFSKDLTVIFNKYFHVASEKVKLMNSYKTFQHSPKQVIVNLVGFIEEFYSQNDNVFDCLEQIFVFSIMWTIGGYLSPEDKKLFEAVLIDMSSPDILPQQSLWECYFCVKSKQFKTFQELTPNLGPTLKTLTLDVTVPTLESTRLSFIIKHFGKTIPLFLVDPVQDHCKEISKSIQKYFQDSNWLVSRIFLSTCTKSEDIQNELKAGLQQRRKHSIGPTLKSHHTYLVHESTSLDRCDDREDNIEFLRQLIEMGGYYDRESWNMTKLLDVSLVGVISERISLSKILIENCLLIRPVTTAYEFIKNFFNLVIKRLGLTLPANVQECITKILDTIVLFWQYLDRNYKNSFSFFDMKRILVGTLQTNSLVTFSSPRPLIKLFQYETIRVCCDSRYSNGEKQSIFAEFQSLCQGKFNESFQIQHSTVFADFSLKISDKITDRTYEEIADLEKLKITLSDYLVDYNQQIGTNYHIFWHNQLLMQLSRVCGMIRLPQFHCCLSGGMAKKMLCKLAAFINNYQLLELKGGENFARQIKQAIDMIPNMTNKSLFLQISNLTDLNNLKLIANILDYGYPPVFLLKLEDKLPPNTIENLRNRINIILLYDHPEDMKASMASFPTIRKHCPPYYLENWGPDEYQSIAQEIFNKIQIPPTESRVTLAKLAVRIHMELEASCNPSRFGRKFLHLIRLFELLWHQQKGDLTERLLRFMSCQTKLGDIHVMIASMQQDLKLYLPQLEERKGTLREMKINLDHEVTSCDCIRSRVMLDEGAAKIQAASTQELTDDVNKDLEIAMPALRAAQDQMKALSKGDWNELKGQNNPAKLVAFVMEAVCILLKIKPDWPTAKALINEPNFLKKILEFDKENISEMVSKKIKAYIEHKDFDPAKIEKVSKVSKCLCLWVKAIDQFAKVFKIVEPKVKKQQHAEAARRTAMTELRRKQQELADSESKIQIQKDNIEEYETAFKVLQENVDLINVRLTRAHRVTTALAEEELSWSGEVKNIETRLKQLPCDVLFISATIAHLGKYSERKRIEFRKSWIKCGQEIGFQVNEKFSLKDLLIDDLCVTQWQSLGLPKDNISLENALIIKNSLRYPLLLDFHERIVKWILKIEPNITILHHKHKDFTEAFKDAVMLGDRVLIPEIGFPINELLLEVIVGEVVTINTETFLQTSSILIPFKSSFFLYLVTKSPLTEFPGEFLNNINIIDCKISTKGHEEYILSRSSEVELNAMKSQSTEVQIRIEEDCQRMKTLQGTIINLLHESSGNILDNEYLVAALYETKETYSIVVDRLNDSRESEKVLISIKEKYRPIAKFGQNFFRLISRLWELDPIYFIPMESFITTFCSSVQKLEGENAHPDINQKRIEHITSDSIKIVFNQVRSCLNREDTIVFAIAILDLIGKETKTIESQTILEEITCNLGLTLFEKLNLNEYFGINPYPIIINPKENSLEALINELRKLKTDVATNFISVGTGNEDIVLKMLDAAYLQQHILIMQNAHFNKNVIKIIEHQLAEIHAKEQINSNFGTYKLILILDDSKEVPLSILYNSCIISFYSDDTNHLPTNLNEAKIVERFNQIRNNLKGD